MSTHLKIFKRTLTSLFGDAWPLWLLGLSAFTLWPVLLFWSKIELSAPHFVETWIEKCVEGLLFFVVVETIRKRQEIHDRLEQDSKFIDDRLLDPVQGLIRFLEHAASSPRSPDVRAEIGRNWNRLKGAILYDLNDTQIATENPGAMSAIIARLDIDRCQAMVAELLAPTTPSKVFADTSVELLARFRSFRVDFLALMKS